MPEGVEVSLFARSLNQYLQDKTITDIEVLSGRYTKKPVEGLISFKLELPLKVENVNNKGKFIYWTFKDNQRVMFNTLGMTGGWTTIPTKHERLRFKVIDINGKIEDLYFRDIRNFGTVHFKNREDLKDKLDSIGFDIVQNDIDIIEFVKKLYRYPNMNICEILMRQDIFSGIGNYIKAEALWFANIHPNSRVKDLKAEDIANLLDGIKVVAQTAFNAGGATIKDYFRFNNWERTENFFKVYDKKIDSLGNSVNKMETPDGRTTHWSPLKQTRGIINDISN